MTDLTPLFRQCVSIVQSGLAESVKDDFDSVQVRNKKNSFVIDDTFTKETVEFRRELVRFDQLIAEIKSSYLSTDEGYSRQQRLSDNDKDQIDNNCNIRLQKMYEKLKFLQTYETKRQGLNPKKEGSWLNSILGDDQPTQQELFLTTVGTHRMQILRDLNNNLNYVSNQFGGLQKKRRERERQMKILNFQNLAEDDDIGLFQAPDTFNDIPQEPEFLQELSQEQIQELETENKALLKAKVDQLSSVEKLHTSMVDVMNLQTELTFQLETQADQINNLLDSHSQVEIDVQMGNRTLNKATVRNKKGANMLVTLGIVLGILLLMVDYVSF
ncbi:uncharacterized protein CANTADRAFT_90559 [Suhomyces tanzawaensis NRRL Y-17324]|uniref:t-SNARE coiled-coil homology domain-containing protein n=1 Tax=Suhomyces tanzawaensis NRRL Y-17324 TaxID=984487 RepID=A0A1E4SJ02_9ASCO|nr:uncharacterized protein CANTADRAFT_90559 [Suhomyces tanzawaensis NRRL Y-17324]ODV79481.1 hypothetical protein CANTADRAFT_90559 [Suhomyces tanzawaensis NRRL Y-17324]